MRGAFQHARPVEGAVATVQSLAAEGVQLGVVSSAVHHDFLLWSLDRYGMLASFDDVATSASCGFYKSRPEIYWSALENLHANSASALHIGDSLRFDVGGASRAGMRTAWYQRPGARELPTQDLMPNLIVQSMGGIAPALVALLASE